MKLAVQRTARTRIKDDALAAALNALTLASKNLKNVAVFVIRNVLSSFEQEQLKPELNANQREVLDRANRAVEAVNATRSRKNAEKAAKLAELEALHEAGSISTAEWEQQSKRLKPGKPLRRFDAPDVSPFQILDDSLLDKLLQLYRDDRDLLPYAALPGAFAQQVRKQVAGDFRNWLAALKHYNRNPQAFTGRPRMPGYADRHGRCPVKCPAAQLPGKESLRLIGIEGKALFLDYDKTQPLPDAALEAYGAFALGRLLTAMGKRFGEGARLLEVRIQPKGRQRIVLDAVFESTAEVDDASPMARLYALAEERKLPASERNDFFLKELREQPLESLPVSAGLDFGLNNLLTLGFTNGAKSLVLSHQRFEHRVAKFDRRIDEYVAKAQGGRLAELQSRSDKARAAGTKLDSAEHRELVALRRAAYAEPGYRHLREQRENWIGDALHKVATGTVKRLVELGVQVLAVGLNRQWKTGVDMGRKQNRRFLATAHTRLLELLRYRCEAAGILLVESEESYTSRTSFAANERLRSKHDKADTAGDDVPAAEPDGTEPCEPRTRAGSRRKVKGARSGSRHVFVTKGLSNRWHRIHADVNGALNLLRRVFARFRCHSGLSSSFELLWLSPHKGLTAFRA